MNRLTGHIAPHPTELVAAYQRNKRNATLLVLFISFAVVTSVLGLPFVFSESVQWSELNGLLLLGTVSFSIGIGIHSYATLGARSALLLGSIAVTVGWFAEYSGLRFGFPFFEHYSYHKDIQPKLGGVPLFIPLSWWVLSYMPVVYLRSLSVEEIDGNRWHRWQRILAKAALCSACLTGADLLLDPLAHSVHAWTWQNQGAYFGIPFANFVGWFLVGLAIYLPFFALLGRRTETPKLFDAILVFANEAMAVLGCLAALLHLGSPIPVALFLLTVGPFWIYWHSQADVVEEARQVMASPA